MKKISIPALLFLFNAFIFSQSVTIKSLKAYTTGDETSLPVIYYSQEGGNNITIEFDIESEFVPNLNIVFRYCDKNWNPTSNMFLINHGKNIAYFLDYITLPTTVADAKYRFKGNFPSDFQDLEFPFSGKWMYFITESDDTSKLYASGKFYVVHEEVVMRTSIKREQLEDKSYFPADLAKVFNLTSEINLPDELFPAFVTHIEIVENQKVSRPILVDRNFNTNQRQFYWDGNRKLSFTARDILPVNEYRQTDLRNINVFNSKDVKAQFDGIETSRFFIEAPKDLNGGSILTNFKDEFATYLNVTFSIRPPDEISGNVFLVGAFNNWQLLPDFEMENSGGLFTKTISLKIGIYDYQYVLADVINGSLKNENWVVLEGNSWETSNIYHVFLYYNDQNYGGYDKVIGYSKIISR
ncbi:MAG TPA: type IX secretion system plug protein domain-containing protein [Ignavibacteriaceae bacterium]|nr:type IX secretion system plug protein domain-containing protein [Ignavibacteriaceae bacterium]